MYLHTPYSFWDVFERGRVILPNASYSCPHSYEPSCHYPHSHSGSRAGSGRRRDHARWPAYKCNDASSSALCPGRNCSIRLWLDGKCSTVGFWKTAGTLCSLFLLVCPAHLVACL